MIEESPDTIFVMEVAVNSFEPVLTACVHL